jgi:hypothetical protein
MMIKYLRRAAYSILFLSPLMLQPPASNAAAPMPADAVVLHPQVVFDAGLQKNAYSILAPDGWKVQGQITWMPTLPTPFIDLSVSNPDLHAAWRQFPRIGYNDGIRQNYEAMFPNQREQAEQKYADGQMAPSGFEIETLPQSPRDYVINILAPKLCQEVANAKDLKVVSETDMPDFAKAQADADPLHRQFISSRFRLSYTAADGPVEREFVATLIIMRYPAQKIGPTMLWMGDATTCRAPQGKLDALMPTFTAIGSSVKVLLPWYNEELQVAQMFLQEEQKMEAEMLQDQRNAINERMQILQQEAQESSQEVSDRIKQNFQEQQQAKSQEQTAFMHYINNTTGYTDPNDGSTLSLESNFKYQYESNNGDIIQTNDPAFQPPVDPKTSWQPMQKAN